MLKKMIKKAYRILSFGHITEVRETREEIDKRVKKLEATLNGESHWMLEKVEKKDHKKFECDCEEL